MKNIKDYIVVLKNIVPNELCDAILAEYLKSSDWADAPIDLGKLDKTRRNCTGVAMSEPSVIQNNKERARLDAEVFKCAAKCIEEYNKKFKKVNIKEDTGYELLRYNKGQFYIQHVDSSAEEHRLVSCSFHLNDDYEGGEFGFFNREMKIKAGKGDVVMFPSNFMYPHEIMPVTKGTRYSIITWYR